MERLNWIGIITSLFSLLPINVASGLTCFPNAEGYGTGWSVQDWTDTTPDVYRVVNCNSGNSVSQTADYGTWKDYDATYEGAVKASGARVIIFETSGTIDIDGEILSTNSYCVIAGQTAPSPGICIKGGNLAIEGHHWLIQHQRFRAGDWGIDEEQMDSFQIGDWTTLESYNIVIDHCTVSFGTDENFEIWSRSETSGYGDGHIHDITVRYCLVSQPLDDTDHPKGAHGKGLIISGGVSDYSLQRNLFVHCPDRLPYIKHGTRGVVLNNVVHNPDYYSSVYGADDGNQTASESAKVGCVVQSGVSTASLKIRITADVHDDSEIFLSYNIFDGTQPDEGNDQWGSTYVSDGKSGAVRVDASPVDLSSYTILTSEGDIRSAVSCYVGARPQDRDSNEQEMVNDWITDDGVVINCVEAGADPRCARNAGGWPTLAENSRALTLPNNPHSDDDSDGYSNLEEWLHDSASFIETGAPSWPPVLEGARGASEVLFLFRGVGRMSNGGRSYRMQ